MSDEQFNLDGWQALLLAEFPAMAARLMPQVCVISGRQSGTANLAYHEWGQDDEPD